MTMVARRGGEVYSSLCRFELRTTVDDVDASRWSNDSLKPNFGLDVLERREEEEARSRQGLDMAVSGDLSDSQSSAARREVTSGADHSQSPTS